MRIHKDYDPRFCSCMTGMMHRNLICIPKPGNDIFVSFLSPALTTLRLWSKLVDNWHKAIVSFWTSLVNKWNSWQFLSKQYKLLNNLILTGSLTWNQQSLLVRALDFIFMNYGLLKANVFWTTIIFIFATNLSAICFYWKVSIAESFYNVKYGLSIITSKVSQKSQ